MRPVTAGTFAVLLAAAGSVTAAGPSAAAPVAVRHPTVAAGAAVSAGAAANQPRVLRVGTWHGVPGQFHSIQKAVNAAHPGDIVLIGPGDWKTHHWRAPRSRPYSPAGVFIHTTGITVRGMNRDRVIIDGTRRGAPCSSHRGAQSFGPKLNGKRTGLNGLMVWKADNVRIQNLTACNFLQGPAGSSGNEIWWNGGDDSGKVGGWGYHGSYLTATSTYFAGEKTAAAYGIFSSNWDGGTWNHSYASNFNDSGYYIGACRQICNQVVNHAWAEFNVLGYSGSNSGGKLIVKNSQFDHNQDGFDTNSQNGDNPPPQNGACPHHRISPITHTHSCWVFMHNYVHDNNDANVPSAGLAAEGPVGTGMSISGGRNDTVMDNRFVHNKAWGTIFVPFPDSGPPCTGGTQSGAVCLYDEYGDALLDNLYVNNGGYGNPTNGDFAAANAEPGPTDCFHGNHRPHGKPAKSSPSDAQATYPKCTGQTVPPDTNPEFVQQVACDSQASVGPVGGGSLCPPGTHYPRYKKAVMHPLPGAHRGGGHPAVENPASATLKTMPNPCRGIPANPWCPAKTGGRAASAGRDQNRAVPSATSFMPSSIVIDGRIRNRFHWWSRACTRKVSTSSARALSRTVTVVCSRLT